MMMNVKSTAKGGTKSTMGRPQSQSPQSTKGPFLDNNGAKGTNPASKSLRSGGKGFKSNSIIRSTKLNSVGPAKGATVNLDSTQKKLWYDPEANCYRDEAGAEKPGPAQGGGPGVTSPQSQAYGNTNRSLKFKSNLNSGLKSAHNNKSSVKTVTSPGSANHFTKISSQFGTVRSVRQGPPGTTTTNFHTPSTVNTGPGGRTLGTTVATPATGQLNFAPLGAGTKKGAYYDPELGAWVKENPIKGPTSPPTSSDSSSSEDGIDGKRKKGTGADKDVIIGNSNFNPYNPYQPASHWESRKQSHLDDPNIRRSGKKKRDKETDKTLACCCIGTVVFILIAATLVSVVLYSQDMCGGGGLENGNNNRGRGNLGGKPGDGTNGSSTGAAEPDKPTDALRFHFSNKTSYLEPMLTPLILDFLLAGTNVASSSTKTMDLKNGLLRVCGIKKAGDIAKEKASSKGDNDSDREEGYDNGKNSVSPPIAIDPIVLYMEREKLVELVKDSPSIQQLIIGSEGSESSAAAAEIFELKLEPTREDLRGGNAKEETLDEMVTIPAELIKEPEGGDSSEKYSSQEWKDYFRNQLKFRLKWSVRVSGIRAVASVEGKTGEITYSGTDNSETSTTIPDSLDNQLYMSFGSALLDLLRTIDPDAIKDEPTPAEEDPSKSLLSLFFVDNPTPSPLEFFVSPGPLSVDQETGILAPVNTFLPPGNLKSEHSTQTLTSFPKLSKSFETKLKIRLRNLKEGECAIKNVFWELMDDSAKMDIGSLKGKNETNGGGGSGGSGSGTGSEGVNVDNEGGGGAANSSTGLTGGNGSGNGGSGGTGKGKGKGNRTKDDKEDSNVNAGAGSGSPTQAAPTTAANPGSQQGNQHEQTIKILQTHQAWAVACVLRRCFPPNCLHSVQGKRFPREIEIQVEDLDQVLTAALKDFKQLFPAIETQQELKDSLSLESIRARFTERQGQYTRPLTIGKIAEFLTPTVLPGFGFQALYQGGFNCEEIEESLFGLKQAAREESGDIDGVFRLKCCEVVLGGKEFVFKRGLPRSFTNTASGSEPTEAIFKTIFESERTLDQSLVPFRDWQTTKDLSANPAAQEQDAFKVVKLLVAESQRGLASETEKQNYSVSAACLARLGFGFNNTYTPKMCFYLLRGLKERAGFGNFDDISGNLTQKHFFMKEVANVPLGKEFYKAQGVDVNALAAVLPSEAFDIAMDRIGGAGWEWMIKYGHLSPMPRVDSSGRQKTSLLEELLPDLQMLGRDKKFLDAHVEKSMFCGIFLSAVFERYSRIFQFYAQELAETGDKSVILNDSDSKVDRITDENGYRPRLADREETNAIAMWEREAPLFKDILLKDDNLKNGLVELIKINNGEDKTFKNVAGLSRNIFTHSDSLPKAATNGLECYKLYDNIFTKNELKCADIPQLTGQSIGPKCHQSLVHMLDSILGITWKDIHTLDGCDAAHTFNDLVVMDIKRHESMVSSTVSSRALANDFDKFNIDVGSHLNVGLQSVLEAKAFERMQGEGCFPEGVNTQLGTLSNDMRSAARLHKFFLASYDFNNNNTDCKTLTTVQVQTSCKTSSCHSTVKNLAALFDLPDKSQRERRNNNYYFVRKFALSWKIMIDPLTQKVKPGWKVHAGDGSLSSLVFPQEFYVDGMSYDSFVKHLANDAKEDACFYTSPPHASTTAFHDVQLCRMRALGMISVNASSNLLERSGNSNWTSESDDHGPLENQVRIYKTRQGRPIEITKDGRILKGVGNLARQTLTEAMAAWKRGCPSEIRFECCLRRIFDFCKRTQKVYDFNHYPNENPLKNPYYRYVVDCARRLPNVNHKKHHEDLLEILAELRRPNSLDGEKAELREQLEKFEKWTKGEGTKPQAQYQ